MLNETITIPSIHHGKRIDQSLALLWPQFSRSRIAEWLKTGHITINHERWSPKQKVQGLERARLHAEAEINTTDKPEPIALQIIHEDQDLLIINKPVGLVVHPAAGNLSGTLLNALLHYHPALAELPRAGIIHRLDKDTSGLLIIAKTLTAHTKLVQALQDREISREYLAVIHGQLTGGGTIKTLIDRHPKHRTKMAVVEFGGKIAITRFFVLERFANHTFIRVELETGRTHQIRVHMADRHHAVVGDQVYGGRLKIPRGATLELIDYLKQFRRQALHAFRLTLAHPRTKKVMTFETPMPDDMAKLLSLLQQDREKKQML